MLVGVVGAVIAFISVCFNTFLFVVLCRNPRHRHSHLVYLMFLSVADIFLSAAYILLFPVNLYMDYFASELLAAAWWSYMRIMITISHVFISTSAFLICAAAFERFVLFGRFLFKNNQYLKVHNNFKNCVPVCSSSPAYNYWGMYFHCNYCQGANVFWVWGNLKN